MVYRNGKAVAVTFGSKASSSSVALLYKRRIATNDWDDNKQAVVQISDVVADEEQQLIIPIPQKFSKNDYENANISCIEQKNGYLVFQAKRVPNTVIYLNVFIINAFRVDTVEFEWWSPHMTSNTTPSPYVVAADSSTSSSPPYKAFDGIKTTGYIEIWYTDSSSGSHWISFDFGKQTLVKAISLTARFYNGATPGWDLVFPDHGDIDGSLDGVNWTKITDFSGWARRDDGRTEIIEFSMECSYRYYRVSNMPGNTVGISEIEFLKETDT